MAAVPRQIRGARWLADPPFWVVVQTSYDWTAESKMHGPPGTRVFHVEWVSKLSKAKLSKARIIILGGIAGWFVLSVICGMEFGLHYSPNYSDQAQTERFMYANSRKDEVSDDDVKIHVVAPPYRWDYSLSSNSVKQNI